MSEIWVFGSVSATRFGIMNGTFELGFPRAEMTSPVGSLSTMRKVFGLTTWSSFTKDIIFWPIESFAAQRLMDATQSSAVTGLPSCQRSPSRSVSVYVSRSALSSCLSTIWGRISPLASIANRVS